MVSKRFGIQLSALIALMSAMLWSQRARGAEASEGFIVSLDQKELVVNLGTDQGLVPKSKILLFRRLVVMHPYSKKPIVDRFPIGAVIPDEVGKRLSIIRRWNTLSRAPERGDIAVFRIQPQIKRTRPKPMTVSSNKKGMSADGVALHNVFVSTLGEPIDNRIIAYQNFIKGFPKSELVDAVGAEIYTLREFEKSMRAPKVAAVQAKTPTSPPQIKARAAQPSPIAVDESLEIVVAIANPEYIDQVSLLLARSAKAQGNSAKRKATEGWKVIKMSRDGDYYYRAKLPAELVKDPGEIDYFIEAVRKNATFEAIHKSSSDPGKITVNLPPAGDQAPGKTQVSIIGRMVDFNQPGEARDGYNQFETTISYDINYQNLRAVRFGIGSLSGGCTLSDESECVDDWSGAQKESDEQRLSLNYAFAEAEIGGQWIGFAGRLTGGNHQGGVGNTARKANGFEVRARIGELQKTRLVLGLATLDDLGSKGFLDAHIEVLEKIPLKAGVVVTSLPVQSKDWGVQLSAQAGYRITDMLSLQSLFGWNLRTINHYGFTLGGGLGLEW